MSCRSFKTEVFFTLPICGLIVCLVCTSLITEHWVTGKAKTRNDTDLSSLDYNYGLFNGVKTVKVASSAVNPVKLNVVCKSGRCMFTCAKNKKEDLDDILSECPLKNSYGDNMMCEGSLNIYSKASCDDPTTYNSDEINRKEEDMMMRYGPWVAAIFFLIFGLLFTVVASIFSVLNAFSNPIETIVGVYGLILWNSIAAGSYFLVVCIWGGEYDAHLKKFAPISNILRSGGDDGNEWLSAEGQAGLGYSYWLVLVSFFCHLINIGIVGYYIYRKYKPKKKVVDVGYEKGPENVILY